MVNSDYAMQLLKCDFQNLVLLSVGGNSSAFTVPV